MLSCVSLLTTAPPSPPLFPYTTLFRSGSEGGGAGLKGATASSLAAEGRARLEAAGVPDPARDAEVLLGHLLGLDAARFQDRKSTRLNSSHEWISYAVFCLKKKRTTTSR